MKIFRFILFLLVFLSIPALPVYSHDPGLSSLVLKLHTNKLEASMTFALGDINALVPLDQNSDGTVSPEELSQAQPLIEKIATKTLEVYYDQKQIISTGARVRPNENDNLVIEMMFPGETPSHLRVRSMIVESLPPGHRQYLSFQEVRNPVLEDALLSAGDNSFEKNISASASQQSHQSYSFWDFLVLGLKHIITGYDHLLFLFGLLIVCESFSSVVKIITCFTLAHSLTLALATLDLVQIPSQWVEPIIAASIVYVGMENLFRRGHLKYRWLLTLVFGLIHGFGFASVLREMGIATRDKIAVPLVSFNLGVELGQIIIAAIVLPILWRLKQKPNVGLKLVPVCSAIIVAAGSYWFIERVWLH